MNRKFLRKAGLSFYLGSVIGVGFCAILSCALASSLVILEKYFDYRTANIATETILLNDTADFLIDFSDVLGSEWQLSSAEEDRSFREGIWEIDTGSIRGSAYRYYRHQDDERGWAADEIYQQVIRITSPTQAAQTFESVRAYTVRSNYRRPDEWRQINLLNNLALHADRVVAYLQYEDNYHIFLLYQEYIVYLSMPTSLQGRPVVTQDDVVRVILEVDRRF